MNAQDVLEQANRRGIELRVVRDCIRYRPKSKAPAEFVEALRQHKAEIMTYLSQRQKEAKPSPGLDPALCRNPLPPHSAHEYPWECDPNTCLCYRQWQYPRLCQCMPCRWVWPDGIPGKMGAP